MSLNDGLVRRFFPASRLGREASREGGSLWPAVRDTVAHIPHLSSRARGAVPVFMSSAGLSLQALSPHHPCGCHCVTCGRHGVAEA